MHVNFFNDEKNMKNKYWKYICLLGLGAFCWACSDDNPDGGQNSGEPGYEGGQGTEQEITRSYKLGTLAGFEGEIRKQMGHPSVPGEEWRAADPNARLISKYDNIQ